MDIIGIVFWSILGGMWLWILLLDIKLLKTNKALRKQLRQALEELKQSKARPLHCSDTEQKLKPSHLEQSSHQVGRTPHSPS